MFGFEGMMPSKVSTLGTQFLGRDAVAYTFVKPHAQVSKLPTRYLTKCALTFITRTFLDSSMVERTAVNRDVVGSSPTRGALVHRQLSVNFFV